MKYTIVNEETGETFERRHRGVPLSLFLLSFAVAVCCIAVSALCYSQKAQTETAMLELQAANIELIESAEKLERDRWMLELRYNALERNYEKAAGIVRDHIQNGDIVPSTPDEIVMMYQLLE